MSIISEALKKVSDKRRNIVQLSEEDLKKEFGIDIKEEAASKKARWAILSGAGTIVMACAAVLAFLYTRGNLQSFAPPLQSPAVVVSEKLGLPALFPAALPADRTEEAGLLTIPSLMLSGVIEGAGDSLAVINDRILREGDLVNGAMITDIVADSVTLIYNGKELNLRIE